MAVGEGADSVAHKSIRDAICLNYFSGDGNCPSCHRQSECLSLVDDALGFISDLTSKRNSTPVKNGG